MSTFVVRFIGARSGAWAGTVRQVATGEESPFAGVAELLSFLEERVSTVGALHPAGPRPQEAEERREGSSDLKQDLEAEDRGPESASG